MNKQHKVFISYSTRDKHFAEAVCSWLEQHNISCWMAPRNITAGSDYGEAIITALATAPVMVLIFTANANESRFVNREVERAVSRGTTVIPVRFQDIVPTKGLEFFLGSVQWLDAIKPPFKIHLDKLIHHISTVIEKPVPRQVSIISTKEKIKEDIKFFNELAPDDWYTKKSPVSNWFSKLFKDKS